MSSTIKNRVKGVTGTILFHVVLLMLFLFFGLSTPLPLPGEEGVEVNLGTSDEGAGFIQKEQAAQTQTPVPVPEPPAEDNEEILTQEVEETPAIEEVMEEEKEQEKEKGPVPLEENIIEEKPEEIPPEEPKVNPRALYKGKKPSDSEGSNEGTTNQSGDQGQENGDPEAANHTGPGGAGHGVSYSLGGRGALALPKPAYTSQEQGKVVVTIWVNNKGKVVKAVTGAKGTNISDAQLRQLAREAALRSLFTPDPNAPDEQKGTITYNFIRIN